MRSARQEARGRYRLAGGGLEVWWAERRPGAIEWRCRIERGGGGAVETVRLVCDEELRPRGLYVAVHGAGGWRTLEALPRAAGWVAVTVAGPGGTRERRELPLPPDAHVEYPALFLATVTLRRLALAPGESREVPVVAVAAPALVPATGVRRYAREAAGAAEGRAAREAAGVPAREAGPGGPAAGAAVGYTCADPAAGVARRILAAPDGTVLRAEGLGELDRDAEAEG